MDEKLTFEGALQKLEKLVDEMEGGTLPLGEMMKRFEEGRRPSAFGTTELESIRQRVEKVVSAPNEPVRVEPLDA